MRISDWSSDVCSSDLARIMSPSAECLMTRIAMIALCRLVGRSLLRDARHAGHHAQRRPQHHGRPVAEEALGGGDREQRDDQAAAERSEERRVGKEWVSTGRSGWAPDSSKNNKK